MRLLAAIALAAMLWTCQGVAQFEGIVETRNLTTDETGSLQQFTMTMWIKPDRIRVQSSAFGMTPPTTMIYRSDRRILWMLNDEEKNYFEILRDETVQGDNTARQAPEDKPAIRRSGKTRKILGYACEQIMATRGEEATEMWGTKELSALMTTTQKVLGSGAESGGWMDEIASLGLYPLAASTRIEGRLIESQETTKIQAKELSPDLFVIPSGYKKQSMGDAQEPPH